MSKVRMQVAVESDVWVKLVEWELLVKKETLADVGIGKISALLLEELVKHPELIEKFLLEKRGGTQAEGVPDTQQSGTGQKKGHARKHAA